ncbi:uncharacterized protein LOC130054980 [Ostrea edulis]|uniref:uncharacterized protein LOC130054980 n=1 Tax=Ostrea edulis TaxID=37623 RepID=UPI0024AF8CBE|nr:uncharacterized protein LOC130054980 [Ostrea edulis]
MSLSRINPSEIYYSQDSIKEKFFDGQTIYSSLSECREKPYVINMIPTMRVCLKDGKWYTLDNRRLWVFKRLEAEGYISDVEVMIVSSSELTASKFTTNNGGTSVIIRQPVNDSDEDDDFGYYNDTDSDGDLWDI